ncbi:unnamed protein product [Caenorhabditis brenneri]
MHLREAGETVGPQFRRHATFLSEFRYSSKISRSKMPSLLETDERIYRTCIYYEAMCKTPVEKAYKRMKKVKPNLDYLDFEFWYYRFLGGSLDFDYDRSNDPKTRGLSDMPIEVAENIVGNLGLIDKLSTQRVCRKLRAVIDNQPLEFGTASMKITDSYCDIQFEQRRIGYYARKNEGDYPKMAFDKLISVITNPKWSFEELDLDFPCGYFSSQDSGKHINLFNSMLTNRQIRVKELTIAATSLVPVVDLISHFDADLLESIDFKFDQSHEESTERLHKMDQWKNAKQLKLSKLPEWLPFESLFHCKEFAIEEELDLNFEDFEQIGNILFKSPIFESCSFVIGNDDDQEWTEEYFFETLPNPTDRYRHHYSIANSNDYFECTYEEDRKYGQQYPPAKIGIRRVHV